MFHKKDKNLWAFTLPLSVLLSGCWFEKKNAGEDDLTTIKEFSVEPKSVAEGDAVKFKILGENIKSCTLYANDNEISALSLTDDEVTSHIPDSINTAYKAVCSGETGTAETEAVNVNIILADDIIKSDTIADISTKFDIEAIKASIAEEYPNYKIMDFSSEYNDELPKPDNEVLRVDSSSAALDIENSIIYGFEGNLNSKHNQVCRDTLNLEASVDSAEFNSVLDNSTIEKEMILEDRIHIDSFEAVTQELANPIPANTEWDISYSLVKTQIVYQDNIVEYSRARGSFKIDSEGNPVFEDNRIDLNFLADTEKWSTRNFPRHYPVPPSKNGYEFDPNHETCNGNTLAEVPVVYQNGNGPEMCRKSHLRRKFSEYCRWIDGGRDPRQRPVITPTFPYTDRVKKLFRQISYYGVQPVPSKRVITHPTQMNCKQMFPSVASQVGLNGAWTTNYAAAQWFIHDRQWPTCNGANCAGKSLRNGPNDLRYNNIERYSNRCIDRWKGRSWSDYQNSILAQCKREKAYTDAVAEIEGQGAIEQMVNACLANESCEKLVISIKESTKNNLFSSNILDHAKKLKTKYNKAKNENKSFIISSDDKYFSKLSQIKNISQGMNESALGAINNARGNAIWEQGLKRLINAEVPVHYHSYSNLENSAKDFREAINIMDEISSIKIKEQACNWSAKGKFRVFKENRLLEIRKVEIEEIKARGSFKNITPIVLD